MFNVTFKIQNLGGTAISSFYQFYFEQIMQVFKYHVDQLCNDQFCLIESHFLVHCTVHRVIKFDRMYKFTVSVELLIVY